MEQGIGVKRGQRSDRAGPAENNLSPESQGLQQSQEAGV